MVDVPPVRRRVPLILAFVALGTSACGGGSSPSGTVGSTPTAPSDTTQQGSAPSTARGDFCAAVQGKKLTAAPGTATPRRFVIEKDGYKVEVAILRVTRMKKIRDAIGHGRAFNPAPDHAFLAVEFGFENLGRRPASASMTVNSQFFLVDRRLRTWAHADRDTCGTVSANYARAAGLHLLPSTALTRRHGSSTAVVYVVPRAVASLHRLVWLLSNGRAVVLPRVASG